MKPNFKRKDRRSTDRKLYAPVNGKTVPLSMVSDPVYASKMYGEGVAIEPADGTICAPCAGTLTLISAGRHAFGVETEQGEKVYVHVGFGTSELRGQGFEVIAQEGTKVRAGTPVLKVNTDFFESRGTDLTTVMIVTTSKTGDYKITESDAAQAGKTALMERR